MQTRVASKRLRLADSSRPWTIRKPAIQWKRKLRKRKLKKGKQIIFHIISYLRFFSYFFSYLFIVYLSYPVTPSIYLHSFASLHMRVQAQTRSLPRLMQFMITLGKLHISVVSLVSAHAHDPVLKVAGGLGIVSRQIIARCMSVHTLNLKANLWHLNGSKSSYVHAVNAHLASMTLPYFSLRMRFKLKLPASSSKRRSFMMMSFSFCPFLDLNYDVDTGRFTKSLIYNIIYI